MAPLGTMIYPEIFSKALLPISWPSYGRLFSRYRNCFPDSAVFFGLLVVERFEISTDVFTGEMLKGVFKNGR